MARQRLSPSQRVEALARAAADNEPYRMLVDSPYWEPLCSIFDGMFYRTEAVFRQGKIGAKQHRANMNAIETLKGTIEGGAESARKLHAEIIELDKHEKKTSLTHLPGA